MDSGIILGIVLGALVVVIVAGSIARNLAASARVFDYGGMLPPGLGGVYNRTGQVEILKMMYQNLT